MATYALLKSGEHERVNERNPSKASAKAPAFIYSGAILLYRLQKNALLRVPVTGCERTSACVHPSLRESTIYYAQRTFAARVMVQVCDV